MQLEDVRRLQRRELDDVRALRDLAFPEGRPGLRVKAKKAMLRKISRSGDELRLRLGDADSFGAASRGMAPGAPFRLSSELRVGLACLNLSRITVGANAAVRKG